ncbi:MAG: phosphatase PAP2 family protein [Pseudonocardiales bacterium]
MTTAAPQVHAGRRFGARALLLALAIGLLAVPFLTLVLLVEDRSAGLREVDDGARDGLHSYVRQHAVLVTALKALSFSGSTLAWTVVFVPIALWLLWRRLYRLAAFVAITVVLSSLLNNAVKTLVHRTRPVFSDPVAHAGGASFPSGHAQAAMVGYGVLTLVFLPALRGGWRRLAVVVAVLMVLGIGFSRVALGVHYVSDVLAGYVLGAAWLIAMTAAFSAWRRERGRPAVRPSEGLEPEQAQRLTP